MPNIFYSPAGYSAQMLLGDKTIGPISGNKVGGQPATGGTIPAAVGQQPPALGIYPPSYGSFPQYNLVGKNADAGEVADCLNQIILRIQAIEEVLNNSTAYGVIQT
jgi:hypothetical protein